MKAKKIFAFCSAIMICMSLLCSSVMALEIKNVSENTEDISETSDYIECKTTLVPINDVTYCIVTPENEVIGFYEIEPVATPRGNWSYSWTVEPDKLYGAVDHVTSYNGFYMDFTMNFSRKGDSSIGVLAHDEEVFYIVFEKDDSFSGRITFTRDMGSVSFGIRNDSSNTITYSGTLDY